MSMVVDAASLRRSARQARDALSPAHRIHAAQALASRLIAIPGRPASGYAAGYWAVGGEIALHAWQVGLPAGLVYCLPRLADDGRLRFAPWRPGDPLTANRFGIPEPDVTLDACLPAEALAMAVVPLVAFDARCHRLGMGGGWYDRTFAPRPDAPRPMLVGAAFEAQHVAAITPEPWDVPLDVVCTESHTYVREPA